MSSSSEALIRGGIADAARPVRGPELRTGVWTRLGDPAVLGDATTEQALERLAEATRSAARSQGYAVGWAEGRREAARAAAETARLREAEHAEDRARREAEHAEAVAGLRRAAELVAATAARAEALVHDQALTLARELTEALVGHELRSSPERADDVIRRVLAERTGHTPVVARVHPGLVDAATAADLAAQGVRLVEDPEIAIDDAIVEVEDHAVDLRVSRQLARVREVLS